ncbi:MAG: hypothetical protein ABIJ31_11570 [Pseudomonadota bacterium]
MQKKYSAMIISIILAGMIPIYGCMELYGRIKPNPGVEKIFKARSGLPDYNYYYTGRPGLPDAVIGIDKKYLFNARVWGKIESHKDVYHKIYHLNYTPSGDSTLNGGDIIDNNGMIIGIWFSYYDQAVVKKHSNGMVEVFTPYDPNSDDHGFDARAK